MTYLGLVARTKYHCDIGVNSTLGDVFMSDGRNTLWLTVASARELARLLYNAADDAALAAKED